MNSFYPKEEFGDMAFWPNDAGRFNIRHPNGWNLTASYGGICAALHMG